MKMCYLCQTEKPESDFPAGNNRCRPCHTQYQRDRRARLSEKNKNIDRSGTKTCSTCGQEKPKTEFGVAYGIKDGLQTQCNPCRRKSRKSYNTSQKGHIQNMLSGARQRSKGKGREFSLTVEDLSGLWDIQEGKCALTGMEMLVDNDNPSYEYGRHPFGPSVDRKDPQKGYTLENVRLTTTMANVATGNWGEEIMTTVFEALLRNRGYSVTLPPQTTPLA
jgi:hypothetical protein